MFSSDISPFSSFLRKIIVICVPRSRERHNACESLDPGFVSESPEGRNQRAARILGCVPSQTGKHSSRLGKGGGDAEEGGTTSAVL